MYKILFAKSAEKEMISLPFSDIDKILAKIETLAHNPYPTGVKKLIGNINLWRIRAGNYRIIYSIFEDELFIDIIRVRHRKDAYKNIRKK
jgi:mRNA interferase RelE/StbE